MREYSNPIPDPTQSHKRCADWVIYERTAASVFVHRFATREDAEAWQTDERLADPEQERELDERRIEARRPGLFGPN